MGASGCFAENSVLVLSPSTLVLTGATTPVREPSVVRMEGSSVKGYCWSFTLPMVFSRFLLPVEVMLKPDSALSPKPLLSVDDALLDLLCCSYSAVLSLL